VLGVVQALSEFLPISSSGHLHIVRWLMGWDELPAQSETAFDVAVHIGSLAGAAAFLRHDVAAYAGAVLKPLIRRAPLSPTGRAGWALAMSAAPAGLAGVAFGESLSGSGQIWLIAVCLIVFGLLLGLADRRGETRGLADFGFVAAAIMGLAQALALQPGVSRSGIVITAARCLVFERAAAVRLAFLMSLPVIAGAGVYGLIELSIPSEMWPALGAGVAVSAVVGWASVWVTLAVAERLRLRPFVIYRVALGAAVLGALAAGWR